jgi:opacity protein-like surface antigen
VTDQSVIDRVGEVIPLLREGATDVDRDGTFPTEQVAALADMGPLGLLLPESVGGLGGGPRDLVDAMTTVASACGSTAMVYLMHLADVRGDGRCATGGWRRPAPCGSRSGSEVGHAGVQREGFARPFLGAGVAGGQVDFELGDE